MAVGPLLRDRRTAQQWTQATLAEFLGVSVKTISNWENDRTMPDIASLIKLSHLYGLSLDHLLTEGSDWVTDMQQKEQMAAFQKWFMIGPQLTSLFLALMLLGPFLFNWPALPDAMLGLLVGAIAANALAGQYFIRRGARNGTATPWRQLQWGYWLVFIGLGVAVLVKRTLLGW
ncbi:helix-turn-helix domain-containing protein [Lacticaseibacillus absianus]|uniref:helix-turn-helix domain-containing protein n=1 Tax=Lacticaseibacillus absianus TaxID=2729623 RepID=UPI0015C71358|nr:helix-turn-helix transcriptional regulator [Lacticaseibacillus absianus]